ncbi:MAG: homocysteine S-methyltransferase family protein [Bacteroidales bacterium]|jgi:5-methyltetrahydrofolate--homocysteine methyltransferase|nr:homocysteine S-methyltransferase family protein [Bacteroidales bacterium]
MFDSNILNERIILMDGAMGTFISSLQLTENQFKGKRFENTDKPLKDLNDILNLTQPEIITSIHRSYLEAGSDIIETNTLNANIVSLSAYGCADLCYEINFQGVQLAKTIAAEYSAKGRQRFVAGAVGTTAKSLTFSAFDGSFTELYQSFLPQINALMDAEADLLIVETIYDLLNAEACLTAINDVCKTKKRSIPTILSCTINNLENRLLSGQTLETFYHTFENRNLLAIGMNCCLGSEQILPYIRKLSAISDIPVYACPNAGLPDKEGSYRQTPSEFVASIEQMLKGGFVNIVGGCCGTTPEHIKLIAEKVNLYSPHPIQKLANPKE